MRILHVTSWYPTDENPLHFLFIKRQIKSLDCHCDQHVLHIDLSFESVPNTVIEKDGVKRIQRRVHFHSWRWREWMFYRILKEELQRLDAKSSFTHINFYIAYPALIYYDRLERYLPAGRMITEHWSAYHYNFHVSKIPKRMREIFHHNIPVACVSKALAQDINNFAGIQQEIRIVPNVVQTEIFRNQELSRGDHYLSVSFWKHPKKPLEILEVFRKQKLEGKNRKLRVGGFGPYEQQILQFIKENKLEDDIQYIGKLLPENLAVELNRAKAFILPTEYETFSVIIAEALACGCPVIANRCGAIPDLINEQNGVLVDNDWMESLAKFEALRYDHNAISKKAIENYSAEVVGAKFFKVLSEL